MAKKRQKPEEQAISPISNTAPPTEHRFKPGQSGNPKGRKTAGATIREWINSIAEGNLTCGEIRKIARDEKLPWTQRAAAERILRTMEAADIADFAGLLRGENNLEDLKAMGVNTEAVKKLKQKTRKIHAGTEIEEIIEREIELYDRAGTDFDRVMDRTEGKPGQNVEISGELKHGTTVELIRSIIADPESARLADALAKRMAVSKSGGNGQSSN